jgi:hypothetical protein
MIEAHRTIIPPDPLHHLGITPIRFKMLPNALCDRQRIAENLHAAKKLFQRHDQRRPERL